MQKVHLTRLLLVTPSFFSRLRRETYYLRDLFNNTGWNLEDFRYVISRFTFDRRRADDVDFLSASLLLCKPWIVVFRRVALCFTDRYNHVADMFVRSMKKKGQKNWILAGSWMNFWRFYCGRESKFLKFN